MPFLPYEPQNLEDDKVLCDYVRLQGGRAVNKRLLKAKSGGFPTNRSPAELNNWWKLLKEGKKKDKYAMIIMALEYEPMLERLDESKLKTLELENKVKLQDEEINKLKTRLQDDEINTKTRLQNDEINTKTRLQDDAINTLKTRLKTQDEEYKQLRKYYEQLYLVKNEIDNDMKSQKLTLDSKKQEIKTLKMRLQQQEEENKYLRMYKEQINQQKLQADEEIETLKTQLEQMQNSQDLVSWSKDSEWKTEKWSGGPLAAANAHRAQLFHFHQQLPDLEEYNYNHEFWKKIREWSTLGLTIDEVCSLVKAKCSPKTLRKVEQEIARKNLSNIAPSNLAQKNRLLDIMEECVSEALGAGTKVTHLFFSRRIKDGETVEDYINEMYRLYCAYGREKGKIPDKNDPAFLHTVAYGLPEEFRDRPLYNCESYTGLLADALAIESWMLKAEKRNHCINCKKNGHIKAQCRKPGGGAQVGPNVCFRCGKRGHHAKNCRN